MADKRKTREQLLLELDEMRERVAELEKAELKTEATLLESEDKICLKSDLILKSEVDIMVEEVSNIIDIPTLQSLMEIFTELTGIPTAILDIKGNVLEATGWQDICTKFHRVNPETKRFCTESDLYLAKNVKPGEYVTYKCKNGLYDVVTPLYIANKHVGNIYTGQFFFDDEEVDESFFIEMADKYGFNQKEYLEAFQRVPRVSREYVTKSMEYLVKFTEFISRLGYSNLKLVRTVAEKEQTEKALGESEERARLKLDSILSPDVDIEEEELANILDSKVLQSLMDALYAITKMGIGIIDLKGNVLVGTGWQDICTKFHRVNPETLKNCIESDLVLSSGLKAGEFRAYKCKNNMWDIVTPIFIGKKHVGNVFLGQFFYEDEIPDYEFFAAQADKYGFDKEEYLKAMDAVPRWSQEKVQNLMQFYAKFAAQISQLGYSNLKLAKTIGEKELTEKKLRKYQEHLKELVDERTSALEEKTEELEEANLRLKELDRLKSMFIASMSHELRTPLNSIIGFTGIILMGMTGEISEEQQKQLTIVKNSAQHLLSLVNDVIDVSKIEAGMVELDLNSFNLSKVIQDSYESFKVAADQKNLELVINTPEILVMENDERRVKQILMNFLSNALKFTDQGKVEVKATETNGMVKIIVKDTGIGIKEEDMGKLFKAFSQIDVEDRSKQEGTGLGLYLSKKIADLLGGEIRAESEFGRGSTFMFTVPMKLKRNNL